MTGEATNDSAAPKLRVVVNAVHARAGGGIAYLRNLLPLLAADRGLAIILIPHATQLATFADLPASVRIHRATTPAGWLPLLLWEQIALPVVARRIGCDVLLSAANFGPLLMQAQVVVVQNAVTAGAHERRLAKKLYWKTLHLMTALSLCIARGAIAVSHHAAEAAAIPLLRHRAPAIVPFGVSPIFSPNPAGAPRETFLLAVGDLYFHKNFHTLIEALAVLRRSRPGLTLRIAGGSIDAAYAERLRRRIAALGLEDAVVFLGRRSAGELVALYRSCAAFVLPSTAESFAMPLVEAMACGAPVITADCAAMPEVAGGAAMLCDPASPADIAEKILHVLEDATLRHALQERGLARAKKFSWADCAGRTAAILREAAAGRPRRGAPTRPISS